MLCNFIEIARRHGCSSLNLLHIFRTPFPKNTSRRLLLLIVFELEICFTATNNRRNSRHYSRLTPTIFNSNLSRLHRCTYYQT